MDRSRILNIYLSLHCGLTISTYYHNPKALFIREAFKKKKCGFLPHLPDHPPHTPPKVWKHILGVKNFPSISP